MDTTELKKAVNKHVEDIDKRLSIIEINTQRRNAWNWLYDLVRKYPGKTDAAVLSEMTQYLGADCLKGLIASVGENFVKDLDEKITAQSCHLKMIIKPKTDAQ
jgi:hypothetical protein